MGLLTVSMTKSQAREAKADTDVQRRARQNSTKRWTHRSPLDNTLLYLRTLFGDIFGPFDDFCAQKNQAKETLPSNVINVEHSTTPSREELTSIHHHSGDPRFTQGYIWGLLVVYLGRKWFFFVMFTSDRIVLFYKSSSSAL